MIWNSGLIRVPPEFPPMHCHRLCYRRLFALLCLLTPGWLHAATPTAPWPTFRGPDRTAVSSEAGLSERWPESGPPLLWQASGAGRGYSSLAIAGGRLFTLGDGPSTKEDKDEYLLAFNQADGQPLWSTKIGPAWNSGQDNWQGSRSTPTVDGDRIYALSPHGALVACESATGQELWRKDLKKDFGGKKGDGWGYGESVLIDGEKLVCMPGGEKSTMLALNKRTGELVWSAVREDDRGAGHASIVIATIGVTRVYVTTTASGALGVRASDGKLLWTYDAKATSVIPTPIIRDDLVFFTAGYGCGGALLRQVPTGSAIDVEEIYPLKRELGNKHGGLVLVGDYLYGDSEDKGTPFCADFMTGEVKWQQRGPGRGSASLVAADGSLYLRFADGTVVLAKAAPDAFHELGKFKLPAGADRPNWSHPVIAEGQLYLRADDYLFCYDLRGQ
jgi:outer membrane protein assembly factor BamB